MPTTERLYYTDCYLTEFTAQVLRTEPDAKGARLYLNRTAFYPDSGGQPTDYGTLGGKELLEAIDEGDEIAHVLKSAPEGGEVTGQIDWGRRFDHMQQHTGQHLLSAAFAKTGGYRTVSFHLGPEVSTIDLDSDRIGHRQSEDAENLVNQVVFENRPVRIFSQAANQANQMNLRKSTSREGDVRLVEVQDFDLSACGGTHVSQTGAVGLILVRKFERIKALTRVEFVCGSRALRMGRLDFAVLSEAARLFSAGVESVPELIAKQAQELREVTRSREKLVEQLAEFKARELCGAARQRAGWRVVRHTFASEEGREAKIVAHAVAKEPAMVALIGVKGKPAVLFFSQSPGGTLDMAKILKDTVTKYGGQGGGTREFAQGGGLDERHLEEALSHAENLLA